MFDIKFKVITEIDEEELIGSEGYFQFKCDDNTYGEYYSEELDGIMDRVTVYDWFSRMLEIVIELQQNDLVYLSDVESYNSWLEFRRKKDQIIISSIEARKPSGTREIQYSVSGKKLIDWEAKTDFKTLKEVVCAKANEYLEKLYILNYDNADNTRIIEEYKNLLKRAEK